MTLDDSESSNQKSSSHVIDLCSPYDEISIGDESSNNSLQRQIVTPYCKSKYDVVEDI